MSQAHPDIIPFPGRPAAPTADTAPAVLVLCSEPAQAQQLAAHVQAAGFATRAAASVEAALQWMQVAPPDVCLIGALAPGDTPGQLAAAIQQKGWSTQLICTSAESAGESANPLPSTIGIELLPAGCTQSYLTLLVSSAVQRSQLLGELRRLKRQLANRNLREMVGHSPAMQTLRQQIQALAEHSAPALLVGECGSGVEQIAQAVHDASRRAHRPFVTIDCSVHSAETLEQELFGVASASPAFGATHQPGRLEQADGGTLLLEEVHCIALPLQRRLAAVLRDQRFEHEATGERIRFDVRLLIATHVDLEELLRRGLFRPELHQDAAQHRLDAPPLRSRPEDIAPLAEHFLRRQAAREGRPPRSLTMDALHLLQSYQWPGNVRELESVIERACTVDCGRKLTAALLEPWLANGVDSDQAPGLSLADMERRLIETTFARFAGNREKTAKALQIGIRTLSGKLREYGYPPRGGPGSNIRPWSPSDEAVADARHADQKAA